MQPLLLLVIFLSLPSRPTSASITLNEILNLKPGTHLSANDVSIMVPRVISNNGIEKILTYEFKAAHLEIDSKPGTESDVVQLENTKLYSGHSEFTRLEDSIDDSVNPCDDFYQHVCAGWIKQNPIDKTKSSSSIFEKMQNSTNELILQLFRNSSLFNLSRERRLMYDFFLKCKDEEEPERLRTKPFFDYLRILKSKKPAYLTDWLISVYPKKEFFEYSVQSDERNSSSYILNIRPTGPNHKFREYTEPAYKGTLDESSKLLRRIYELIASDDVNNEFFGKSPKEIDRKVQNIVNFDMELAKIDAEHPEEKGLFKYMTLQDTTNYITSINFTRYIEAIMPASVRQTLDLSKLEIQLENVEAIQKIDQYLQTISDQALLDVEEHALLGYFIIAMDQRFKQLFEEYTKKVQNTETDKDYFKLCATEAFRTFPDIGSAIFIERHFTQDSFTAATKLVETIRASFGEMLNEVDWMDDETKLKAQVKAARMSEFVGYNPLIFNETYIQEQYHDLEYPQPLTANSMMLALNTWSANKDLGNLLKQPSIADMITSATQANAYYYQQANAIIILAGILQPPYFNADVSPLMNVGALGYVVGHEISHGFDSIGALYDSNGNRVNWWSEKTWKNLVQRQKCFEQQYSEFVVDPLNLTVDGFATLRENIADNGGFKIALRAAQKIILENDIEPGKIPLRLKKYSPLQLFFLNSAYIWCENSRPEALLYSLTADSHSPAKARANVVFRNFKEFSEAFNCPRLLNTCSLW